MNTVTILCMVLQQLSAQYIAHIVCAYVKYMGVHMENRLPSTCVIDVDLSRIDRFSLGPIGGGFQGGRDGSRGEQGSSQRY